VAWTYTIAQIQTTPRFQVRFLCGDTDSTDPLLQDEEIDYLLTVYPNARDAAASACDAIASKFSRQADQSTGDISTSYSQRAKMYAERAATLRSAAGDRSAVAYAGGISISDMSTDQNDTDVVQPAFTRNLDLEPVL